MARNRWNYLKAANYISGQGSGRLIIASLVLDAAAMRVQISGQRAGVKRFMIEASKHVA